MFIPVTAEAKKEKKNIKKKNNPKGYEAPVTGSCSWVAEGQQTGPEMELSWHLMCEPLTVHAAM